MIRFFPLLKLNSKMIDIFVGKNLRLNWKLQNSTIYFKYIQYTKTWRKFRLISLIPKPSYYDTKAIEIMNIIV